MTWRRPRRRGCALCSRSPPTRRYSHADARPRPLPDRAPPRAVRHGREREIAGSVAASVAAARRRGRIAAARTWIAELGDLLRAAISARLAEQPPGRRPHRKRARTRRACSSPRRLGIFAGVGLAISAVGIYGLMAYIVEVRRQEIGIRMALGADAGMLVRGILRGALTLSAAGIVPGLFGAAAGARVLQSLLYETSTADPLTFLLVPLVLVAIALAAAWVPARRAARLDPLAVLRVD